MKIELRFVSMWKERFLSITPNMFFTKDERGFVFGIMVLFWGIGLVFNKKEEENG